MFNDEVNDVYKKLDTLFKIKASKLVKYSGLKFERLLSAVDLIKGYEFYILVIDGKSFNFKDKTALCTLLANHCAEKQQDTKDQLVQLEHHKKHDLHFDDVTYDPLMEQMYYEAEKLGYFIQHLNELKTKSKAG